MRTVWENFVSFFSKKYAARLHVGRAFGHVPLFEYLFIHARGLIPGVMSGKAVLLLRQVHTAGEIADKVLNKNLLPEEHRALDNYLKSHKINSESLEAHDLCSQALTPVSDISSPEYKALNKSSPEYNKLKNHLKSHKTTFEFLVSTDAKNFLRSKALAPVQDISSTDHTTSTTTATTATTKSQPKNVLILQVNAAQRRTIGTYLVENATTSGEKKYTPVPAYTYLLSQLEDTTDENLKKATEHFKKPAQKSGIPSPTAEVGAEAKEETEPLTKPLNQASPKVKAQAVGVASDSDRNISQKTATERPTPNNEPVMPTSPPTIPPSNTPHTTFNK